VQKVIDNYF